MCQKALLVVGEINSSQEKRFSVSFHQIPGCFTSLSFETIWRWNSQRICILCVLWQASCLDFYFSVPWATHNTAFELLCIFGPFPNISIPWTTADSEGLKAGMCIWADSCTATLQWEGSGVWLQEHRRGAGRWVSCTCRCQENEK